jgi:pyruvate/2-oxoglutarate dehydrogenase complex dihydrolipoamide acyltransferase (E2) component
MDPTRVGRYEVLRELGRGGMATVHLARQLDLDRLVALKRLDGLADEDDVRVRRFVREARLAASLSHPNIVTVHDAFEADGVPYIAMELVPGGTLREVLVGLSLEQIAGVLDGVLAGLVHAERRSIVHRDLKPENLMVTAEGGIKITDFGIAKATSAAQGDDGPLTTAGVAIGTPAYMAPEQALAEPTGPRTDLYAVGVIAFELLTGHVPFEDPESPMKVLMQHVNEPPPAVTDLRPQVDPELSGWVAGLLAKAPEDRPPGAAAAQDRLEDIVLRLRGGRWRREAPLPIMADDAPVPTAALAAPAPPSSERTRAGRRTPPPPVRDDTAPRASRPRVRRVPRVVMLALLAGVSAAAIAAGAKGVGGGAPATRGADPAVQVSQPEAVGSPVASPAPPAVASATAASAAIDPARVVDAEREARRFAEEAQDTEGDGDEALTQQLRDTQYAYRDAAAAASAGDTARFTSTLAKADALARSALERLDGDSGDDNDGDDEDSDDEDSDEDGDDD